jgi:hypothetical protein
MGRSRTTVEAHFGTSGSGRPCGSAGGSSSLTNPAVHQRISDHEQRRTGHEVHRMDEYNAFKPHNVGMQIPTSSSIPESRRKALYLELRGMLTSRAAMHPTAHPHCRQIID